MSSWPVTGPSKDVLISGQQSDKRQKQIYSPLRKIYAVCSIIVQIAYHKHEFVTKVGFLRSPFSLYPIVDPSPWKL